MKQLTARDMAQIAIVAAIYIVLTITPPLNAMAYYGYQFRVSEMMNFLAFYTLYKTSQQHKEAKHCEAHCMFS